MKNEFEAFARLERHLGRLLVVGVTASAVLLAFGLILLIIAPSGAAAGTLLSAGLMILMATPMLRVVVSAVEYVRMREWFFVLTTLVVLVELAIGVAVALRR
jgi:uncharacterized membrane protein